MLGTLQTGPLVDSGQNSLANRALRVAVLSVPFGGGHRAVAEGVEYALSQSGPTSAISVLDSLDLLYDQLPLSGFGARLYWLLTRFRPLYAAVFWAVDRWPALVGDICSALFRRRAKRWLQRWRPDIVVSTFPLVSYVVGAALEHHNGSPVRLITIVTDAGHVNRSWFAGRIDGFIVTDEGTARFARPLVAGRMVVAVDLPLRRGFDCRPHRAEARARLGLAAGPAVLIWGGGQGLARGIEELVDHLTCREIGVTPIVVTGGNERLAARLRLGTSTSGALVLDYCDDVPALLSAVDAVIGKAGWVSLCEARAAGLPTVCIDALPGQEMENLRVSRELGFATWASNPVEVVDLIRLTRSIDQPTPRAAMGQFDRERLCDLILRGTSEGTETLLGVA
jgi:processive 1,2-diacylglycerol beta-glucosyltransferase